MRRVALVAALALLPALALGQALTYQDRSGTITLGGTAQVLMPVSPSRHGCKVQNISAGDLWINDLGTAALAQPSFKVPSGAQYTCDTTNGVTMGSALSIIGATTAQAFAAREW
jgi:hypothetical protein